MPLKIRWGSKEYRGIWFMLLGVCGLFQVLYIFIAQYLLSIGNYLVVIFIPIGVTIALFIASMIIFEALAEVERSTRLKTQYKKKKENEKLERFLEFPIVKPLLILFVIFSIVFFISYFIGIVWLDNSYSFILAENLSTVVCLFVSNHYEKNIAKVDRL